MVEMSLFDYMCFLSQGVSKLSVKRIGQLLSLFGGKMLKELSQSLFVLRCLLLICFIGICTSYATLLNGCVKIEESVATSLAYIVLNKKERVGLLGFYWTYLILKEIGESLGCGGCSGLMLLHSIFLIQVFDE